MLVILVVLAVAFACDLEEAKPLWDFFQSQWPREYASPEETSARFDIFCENMRQAKLLNEIHPLTKYGVTKFSDMTPTEFQETVLQKAFNREDYFAKSGGERPLTSFKAGNVTPKAWDWTEHGAVTYVKNQLGCGSCWSFSATENIEGQWFLAKHPLVSLSEQQMVDCDHEDHGCNGGNMDLAFKYAVSAGGIMLESDYQYEGFQQPQCHAVPSKFVAKITSYVDLPHHEGKMKEWLHANGPVSIALNAKQLQQYQSGVFEPIFCSPKELDHGLLIVGYGVHKGWVLETDFWKIKNSWGSDWGMDGYFLLKRGDNKCGVAETPSSSVV